MAGEVRVLEPGTVIVWGATGRTSPAPDELFTITNLAIDGTRVGAQADLGVLTAGRGFLFRWWLEFKPSATVELDESFELYGATGDSELATRVEGDVGQADAAIPDGAGQAQLTTPIDTITGRGNASKLVKTGEIVITERYFSPVFVGGASALSSTDNDHLFKLKLLEIVKLA